MKTEHLDRLNSFTIDNLPDLDEVTLGALELFSSTEVTKINFSQFKRPLVVGSGNAAVTGRLLFSDIDAVFADESSYVDKLDKIKSIDGAFLLSASGGKHAVPISTELKSRNLQTILLTNNSEAPAKAIVGEENTFVFPKNREPYTYNTSTYMGMILSKTGENPTKIYDYITLELAGSLPKELASYEAYYLMLPEHFGPLRDMFTTKFDELFGPTLMGRVFTEEQTKHAKTVIPMEKELFISFGVDNKHYGLPQNRFTIPMPDWADYVTMMAVGYYVIGQIQKHKEPYFKERIVQYAAETSEIFNQEIKPIVE